MFKPRRVEPTIVYTPLPSQETDESHAKGGEVDPYLRAENEDDDGYDPYSDRRKEPPLFEENPWD